MNLRIASTEFEIHVTPLERLVFDLYEQGGLLVELDDAQGQRVRLRFKTIHGLRMIHDDYVDHGTVSVEGQYPRRLLELESSDWKNQLVEGATRKHIKVLPQTIKHFVLPLQDYIIEILANEFSIMQNK